MLVIFNIKLIRVWYMRYPLCSRQRHVTPSQLAHRRFQTLSNVPAIAFQHCKALYANINEYHCFVTIIYNTNNLFMLSKVTAHSIQVRACIILHILDRFPTHLNFIFTISQLYLLNITMHFNLIATMNIEIYSI